MRVPVVLAIVLAASLPAAASPAWLLVFDHRGYKAFIDTSSMKVEHGVTSVWIRHDFPHEMPAEDGWPAHRSAIEKRRIDCAARTAGLEHRIVYSEPNGKGEALRGMSLKRFEMLPVVPGTVGDAVVRGVCGA